GEIAMNVGDVGEAGDVLAVAADRTRLRRSAAAEIERGVVAIQRAVEAVRVAVGVHVAAGDRVVIVRDAEHRCRCRAGEGYDRNKLEYFARLRGARDGQGGGKTKQELQRCAHSVLLFSLEAFN